MLKEIKVVRNKLGLFNIVVNEEVVMEMVGEQDIAEAIQYVFSDPDGFIKEMLEEDL